jgi:hypothetical protein
MADQQPFQMRKWMRLGTNFLVNLNRAGIPTGPIKLLAHRGRKSGKTYLTPVTVINTRYASYLVAAFGEVNWVKNTRVSGGAAFIRGKNINRFQVDELSPQDAAPILKVFVKLFGIVPLISHYFQATKNSSREVFEKEAEQHAVFRIIEGAYTRTPLQ